MGLDSIWDEDGNWLKKDSNGFRGRSTGCGCCSMDLETPEEVKKELLDSLGFIIQAAEYFGWDMDKLIAEARQLRQEEIKEASE